VQGSDGFVGIGTSSPASKLQVGWGSDQLQFTNPSAGKKRIGASYTGYVSDNIHASMDLQSAGSSGGDISFNTTPSGGSLTERMRIDESGNVGIGTSSPSSPLDINAADGVADNAFALRVQNLESTDDRSYGVYIQAGSTSVDSALAIYDHTGANSLLWLAGNGNVGIGTSSPTSPNDATTFIHIGNGTNQDTSIVLQDAVETWEIYQNDDLFFLFDTTNVMTLQRLTGNVGIGTSSPSGNLQIVTATAGTVLNVNHNTGGTYPKASGIGLGATSTALSVSSDGSTVLFTGGAGLYAENTAASGNPTNLVFWTNLAGSPAEAMRINSSGNVLVNKTSAYGAKLEVTASAEVAVFQNTGGTGNVRFHDSGGTTIGYIQWSGSSTAYNTSSDYRLKTDAQPMTGASARVQALKPVNFEWISDGTRVDGFLAHEAQAVVPECVTGTKDAMRDQEYEVTAAVLDADGMVVTEAVMGTRSVPDYQGIDQSKLVPLLTAALQEALTKIADMEIRLSALEG
jgi:hypothetical protein